MKGSGTTSKMTGHTALKRMREAAGLTMRQAAALVGLSHVAISQYENNKLNLPDSRIDSLLEAYGYSRSDLDKLLGRARVMSPREDCRSIIERLSDDQLAIVRDVMMQFLKTQHS